MQYQLASADPLDTPVHSTAELVSTLSLPFSSKHTVSNGHIQMDIDANRNIGLKVLFKGILPFG